MFVIIIIIKHCLWHNSKYLDIFHISIVQQSKQSKKIWIEKSKDGVSKVKDVKGKTSLNQPISDLFNPFFLEKG